MRATFLSLVAATAFLASCVVTTEADDDDGGSSSEGTATGGAAGVGGGALVGTAVGGSAQGGSAGVGNPGAGGAGNASAAGEAGKMVGFTAAHNAVRTPLGIADLSWDTTVAVVAQAYAEQLASENCAFYHSMGSYGENLYWAKGFEPTPADVTNSWASEVQFYDYATNSCTPGEMCGHYTQIVWADTERVGCGMAYCSDGSEVWVCNYDPPGNWIGEWPY